MYLNGYISPPDIIAEADLAPYVQDSLDELEFITGPVDSTYGALRASLGYPTPWTIKYVEIGNEDHLGNASYSYSQYRYAAFASAITSKYPNITVISSTGDRTAESPGSVTDYHQYSRPDIFTTEFNYWDNRANAAHLTMVGEYAVIQPNTLPIGTDVDWSAARMPYPSWVGAVSEAVFAIGAERNSYGILGLSYAPLFQNLNSYQWTPDLISFTADPTQNVLSTSYRVIELLSNALYEETVPVTKGDSDVFGPSYWVAGTSGKGRYTVKLAVYNATETQSFNVNFDGVAAGSKANLTVLTAGPLASNVLGGEEVVVRTETQLVASEDGSIAFELENYSVALLTT